MKYRFSTLIARATVYNLYAQVVTSIPFYPTQHDSIVIYFNATQGSQRLMGYTGTVYTHTGVITNESNGNWVHVIGSWGNNDTQPALTRVAENLYELVIGFPRQFYNVTNSSEKILKLAFVFRSSSLDGQPQTEDIFLDLFDPGITMLIEEPFVDLSYGDPLCSPFFASLNDTVHISGKAATVDTEADSIKLFIGDEFLFGVNDSVLTYDFIASNFGYGPQEITLVGSDTAGITDSTSFVIMVNPPIKDAALPEGVIDGINYLDDNSIILSLFAPFKDFIYVIGDFNDWKVDTSFYMNRHYINYNNIHYWLMIDSLDPNEEYAFQ
ncbi:MAG: hypothetical protein KAT41_02680, partial [Candidatus Marinimicrobia bacterium]|nr:hypothetical protein [Candidatus Neomarinimicrobiota bacterium]